MSGTNSILNLVINYYTLILLFSDFGVNSGDQSFDEPCAFQYNSTNMLSGWTNSPNFPGTYPRNIECNYYFYGKRGANVAIRFTYFDVEGVFPCDDNSGSDYVEVSNFLSVDRKFSRKCGKQDGLVVRSDGRFFRMTFRSNDRLEGTGFMAYYSFENDPTTSTERIPEVKQYLRLYNCGISGTQCPLIVGSFVLTLVAILNN